VGVVKAQKREQVFGQHKALSVVYLPVSALKPASRNARTHSSEQIKQLQRSITEFGWTNPILIDDAAGIVAGHGRLQAAIALGMADVPTITLTGLSAAQKRALIIADNKLAMNAGWDDEMLRAELGELGIEGFDLSLIGFSDAELAGFLDTTEGLTDPDDVPDAPAEPVTVLGDVWLLGRHRLVCGDSTTVEAVDACLAGVKPHLMVTDPPYGVKYDPEWRKRAGVNNSDRMGVVQNDDRADWREAWALFPGDVVYVWHGALHAAVVAESLIAADFEVRAQIIWAKASLVMGRGHYHWQHEPCWYAVRKNGTGHWAGDRKQTTLWQIATKGTAVADDATVHSTQKPVECMKRPIENNSSPGQAVYEPFSGSGTTLVAAEMTGRACHAIELSPAYVDVAVLRWQAFSGQQATLDGDGRTFDDIAASRLGVADAAP
jgi:DNA modification methylase